MDTYKKNKFIDDKIWSYCLEHSKPNSRLLCSLKSYTYKNIHGSHMLSETLVTKFLQLLIHLLDPKICIDLGTYTGLSAIAMAEATNNSATIHTIDKVGQSGEKTADFFIKKSDFREKIKVHKKDAIEILSTIKEKIDFAFIDANKSETLKYFNIIFKNLSKKGVIIVDDALWRGEVVKPQNKRSKIFDEFNKYILNNKSLENILLPFRNGLNVIYRKKIIL